MKRLLDLNHYQPSYSSQKGMIMSGFLIQSRFGTTAILKSSFQADQLPGQSTIGGTTTIRAFLGVGRLVLAAFSATSMGARH
jgi:hypothetical protein